MDDLKQYIREVPEFPKPGILFYDITTLLQNPRALRMTVDRFSWMFTDRHIQKVVGIESRGFMFAPGALGRIDVSLPVMAQLLLVMLVMVLIGTTLLTLIAASVKSVKEAQSYMSLLMLLPIIPTLVLLINPLKNELWQFAVPFLAQNQMIMMLVRSDAISPLEWAVYLGAGLGLGLMLWLVAARLYHQEKLAISA